MLTDKQYFFFQLLNDYYKENNKFPTLYTIKKITHYKSYNSIYKYLKILEDKKYLKFNYNNKEITYLKGSTNNDNIFKIPHLNKQEYFYINNSRLKPNYNYLIFNVLNNNMKSFGIIKNDKVIIESNKRFLNNKIVLIYLNNIYQLYKYTKKDGFIHLENDKRVITIPTSECIVGHVIILIRDIF